MEKLRKNKQETITETDHTLQHDMTRPKNVTRSVNRELVQKHRKLCNTKHDNLFFISAIDRPVYKTRQHTAHWTRWRQHKKHGHSKSQHRQRDGLGEGV